MKEIEDMDEGLVIKVQYPLFIGDSNIGYCYFEGSEVKPDGKFLRYGNSKCVVLHDDVMRIKEFATR